MGADSKQDWFSGIVDIHGKMSKKRIVSLISFTRNGMWNIKITGIQLTTFATLPGLGGELIGFQKSNGFFVAFLGWMVFIQQRYHDAVYQENNVIRSNQTESIQQRLRWATISLLLREDFVRRTSKATILGAEQTNLSTSLANYRKAGKSGFAWQVVCFRRWCFDEDPYPTRCWRGKSVIDPDKISSSRKIFYLNSTISLSR